MHEERPSPKRYSLNGYDNRSNQLLHLPPLTKNERQNAVVFFGGDVQDFTENMEVHRENKHYTKWSLDNTALLLQAAFPEAHIIVVRPSKIEYKTYSCFENFVPSAGAGVPCMGIPRHVPMHHALHHLEGLLKNLFEHTNEANNHNLVVIGFSKGCVVLNQFLHEFEPAESTGIEARIREMYWLDGGHNGRQNTWVGCPTILQNFARSGIKAHIHVSPYQIQNDRRPWVGEEEQRFHSTLCRLNAPVFRFVHFSDLPPTILRHFSILNEFYKVHSA